MYMFVQSLLLRAKNQSRTTYPYPQSHKLAHYARSNWSPNFLAAPKKIGKLCVLQPLLFFWPLVSWEWKRTWKLLWGLEFRVWGLEFRVWKEWKRK